MKISNPLGRPYPLGVQTQLIIVKTVNESVNNSTVLQNDDELFFAMAANEVWCIRGGLFCQSPTAAPDVKIGFSVPAAAISEAFSICPNAAGSVVAGMTNEVQSLVVGAVAAAEAALVHFSIGVRNGANAGNWQLQWAQNVAAIENTQVNAGSFLIAERISPL